MTNKLQSILKALNNRHLYQAILLMQEPLHAANNYNLNQQTQDLQLNYSALLNYFAQGQEDPNRQMISLSLYRQAYSIFDKLLQLNTAKFSQYYLMEKNAKNFIPSDEHFSQLKSLFYRTWLSENDTIPENTDEKKVYIAALLLNILEHFNEEKIQHLINIANTEDEDEQVLQHALVSIVVICQKYDNRISCYPTLYNNLTNIYNNETFNEDIRYIFKYILELSLVSRTNLAMLNLQQDIMPKIKKAVDDNNDNKKIIISLDDLEDDVRYLQDEELKSSINEHRKEMMNLFREGGDINYSSIRDVLGNKFFHDDIANWFLPFSTDNPEIEYDSFKDTIAGNILRGLLRMHNAEACDLDLYAFVCMYKQLHKAHTEIEVPDYIKEVGEAEDYEEETADRHTYAQGFIRVLYRFFNNNPWGIENALGQYLYICQTQIFKDVCADNYNKIFAEKMLRLGMFRQAVPLLQNIDADTQQKLGYALQRQAKYEEALQAYRRSLLIEENNWTLQHLATCQKKLGLTEEALQSYEQLLETEPDKKSFLLAKGQLLLDLGKTEQALEVFFKVEMLYPDNIATWRGLGWCALLLGRPVLAEQYLEKIIASNEANASDMMNYAHLLLLTSRKQQALQFYIKSRNKVDKLSEFFNLFKQDKQFLLNSGINPDELTLIEDSIFMLNSQKTEQPS